MEQRNSARKDAAGQQRQTTHLVFGLLVGSGIDQQPRTVRVNTVGGTHQRSVSVLRFEFAAAHTAPPPSSKQHTMRTS